MLVCLSLSPASWSAPLCTVFWRLWVLSALFLSPVLPDACFTSFFFFPFRSSLSALSRSSSEPSLFLTPSLEEALLLTSLNYRTIDFVSPSSRVFFLFPRLTTHTFAFAFLWRPFPIKRLECLTSFPFSSRQVERLDRLTFPIFQRCSSGLSVPPLTEAFFPFISTGSFTLDPSRVFPAAAARDLFWKLISWR